MKISNASSSNLSLENVAVITTNEKTVHKININRLKKSVKSLSNKVKILKVNCAPKVLNALSIFNKKTHMTKIKKNIQEIEGMIVTLNKDIKESKESINTSSYKHNSSKMDSLKTLESELKSFREKLNIAKSNINKKEWRDADAFKKSSPEFQKSEAASNAEEEARDKAFRIAFPDYSHGGMRAGYR